MSQEEQIKRLFADAKDDRQTVVEITCRIIESIGRLEGRIEYLEDSIADDQEPKNSLPHPCTLCPLSYASEEGKREHWRTYHKVQG